MAAPMTLRPYQKEAFDAVFDQWNSGNRKTLLVLPTGTGKTIVFAKVADECVREGKKVLIMAHRGELLEQAADKIQKATGLGCSVEKAEQSCLGSWFRITVGSVQTLMHEKRLKRFPHDYFDTIIIDEAHHSISPSYQVVLQYFDKANVLGVTATPDRADMKNLGSYYQSLAYEYTMPEAIKSGYLAPIKAMTIPLKIDISMVGLSAGDFKAGEVGTALDPYLEQIADEMVKYCMDRKTIVFLPLIKTSQKFCRILNERGFVAAEVNGSSEDRAEVLHDFEEGRYNVLCNSMLLTEGYDCPSVDCIIVLRPTKSRPLYSQMVGRGTRLSPETGKEYLLLLDFLWMTEKHELCHPAALICDDDDVAAQMTKDLEDKANAGNMDAVDIEEAESKASEEVITEREEALAKELAAQRRKKARLVDPLQYAMSIEALDLTNYKPVFGWQAEAPTREQKQRLEKSGINPESIESSGEAEMFLDKISERKRKSLATPRQIKQLERRGFQNVGTWSFEQARNLIDRIAGNGWKTPRSINPKEYVPPKDNPADGNEIWKSSIWKNY